MNLYYDNDLVSLYLGPCEEVVEALPAEHVDLLLTDPPYGIKVGTTRRSKGADRDFNPIIGDGEEFNPAHLLKFERCIIFGGNFMPLLCSTPTKSWLIWNKVDGLTTDKHSVGFGLTFAEAELAWTRGVMPNMKIVGHQWIGWNKASEKAEQRIHPTQKPVALMEAIISEFTKPGDVVFDPYAGSGSTLLAASRLGRRAIGVEMEEEYCLAIKQRFLKGEGE